MTPMSRPGEILKANTDQPLAADPDYSGLKIAPPVMVWIATGVENVINAVFWVVDLLLAGV
jgi:hypothetical protein